MHESVIMPRMSVKVYSAAPSYGTHSRARPGLLVSLPEGRAVAVVVSRLWIIYLLLPWWLVWFILVPMSQNDLPTPSPNRVASVPRSLHPYDLSPAYALFYWAFSIVTTRGHAYIIQKSLATLSQCPSSCLRLPRKKMPRQCKMSGQGFRTCFL